MKIVESLDKSMLKDLHSLQNQPLFETIFTIIDPHCEEITNYFYRVLLNNTVAIKFLNHDSVKNRLQQILPRWLRHAFTYCSSLEEQDAYYTSQVKIGQVHARIDLPMSLVDYGMVVIKNQVLLFLKKSKLKRDELADAIILAIQILDLSLAVMDNSYEHDMLLNEKNAQSLKMNVATQNIAYDYERLCTSLSEWMRHLLLSIAQNKYNPSLQSTIRHSNFGLWVSHKAHLFLAGRTELTQLVTLVDNIDEEMRHLSICTRQKNTHGVQETLERLNDCITQSIILLAKVVKDIMEEENGRDPLTHLFNRRYLETVMRHETSYSLEHGILFGVLVIDIDHFKHINDTYGHENGNRILEQLAGILSQQVRAGDFVFRLGGEEFLIILADVGVMVIQRVAEKIRAIISAHAFKLTHDKISVITVSIGTAIHDGHPDFNRSITLALTALSVAKEKGSNRVSAAPQAPLTYI